MKLKYGILAWIGAAGFAAASAITATANDFPTKDVTHIMPWSAGGGTDTVMRTFLHYVEDPLGVGVRTQNITGAQSGVGVIRLMKSRPDGYTIGSLTWDGMITVPYFELVPGYDLEKLSYLANITLYPTVLAVNADMGWETLDDFITASKAKPGKFKISNSGTSGIWHLHALDMEDKLNIDLTHVPFPNGSAQQREALLSGENEAASISYAAVSTAVDAGQVRVLALMSEERDPNMPNIPTFKELGHDVVWGGMRVLAVPVDTPQDVKETLTTALKAAFDNPEFQRKAKDAGMDAFWMDGPTAEAMLAKTRARATKMLDRLKAEGKLAE